MRFRIRKACVFLLPIFLLGAFIGTPSGIRSVSAAAENKVPAVTPVVAFEPDSPEQRDPTMRLFHYEGGGWIPVERLESTRPTALLVHGIMDSHLGLSAIAERLADPDYGTAFDVFAVRYYPGNGLRGLGLKLEKIIARATVSNPHATDSSVPFVLIAHSMGGLLARYAIESETPSPINRLITISSPLNGNLGSLFITSAADSLRLPLTPVMPELEDMKTGSGFITDLNTNGHVNPACRVLLIAGTSPTGLPYAMVSKHILLNPNDSVVEQWSAWGLPFRQSGAVSVEDARQSSIMSRRYGECTFESFNLNHAQILKHPDVLESIDSWLRRSQPAE